jgi:hypothetical protein
MRTSGTLRFVAPLSTQGRESIEDVPAPADSNVIDLMAALKKNLAQATPQEPAAKAPPAREGGRLRHRRIRASSPPSSCP